MPTQSQPQPEEPNFDVDDASLDELIRITGMRRHDRRDTPLNMELTLSLMTVWDHHDILDANRKPRSSGKTQKQLLRLAQKLHASRAAIQGLSKEALRFLSPADRDEIKMIERASLSIEARVAQMEARLRPRRGAPPRCAENADPYGAFFEFAGFLVDDIIWRGGRATLDKNNGTGTLPAAFRVLKPFLPPSSLPPFLTDDSSIEGLNRLEKIRAAAVRSKAQLDNKSSENLRFLA